MEGLSINNIVTNEDIVITYTPSSFITNYSYKIIKNNKSLDTIYVNNNQVSTIKLSDEGSYEVIISINGVDSETGKYVIDKTAPIINLETKKQVITTKDTVRENITASDSFDGDLTNSITSNISSIDFTKEGIKKIEYTVSDTAGNKSYETMYVTVKKDNSNLILAGQISTILLVFFIILFLIKYIRSIILEKRFSKFTINSSKNNSISLFDNLAIQYNNFINKMNNKLEKINILNNISTKYNKYVIAFNLDSNPMSIISNKIVLGILFILGFIVINLFRFKVVEPYEIFIPFILGYYILDIIYICKYHSYKKEIEDDLVNAITIMNNAFKAGRSIIQAIELVSSELTGPISLEFKKIAMEINLGLDIEVAFDRFSKRIKLEEAAYLTASLSILSKTGGNIIKVFDSIEKTLFSKRKLKEELNSLTSSSRMISYILICIPVVFAVFLNIINPGFFNPLFGNELGIVLFLIMIVIYIAYIFIVRYIMKVRM